MSRSVGGERRQFFRYYMDEYFDLRLHIHYVRGRL